MPKLLESPPSYSNDLELSPCLITWLLLSCCEQCAGTPCHLPFLRDRSLHTSHLGVCLQPHLSLMYSSVSVLSMIRMIFLPKHETTSLAFSEEDGKVIMSDSLHLVEKFLTAVLPHEEQRQEVYPPLASPLRTKNGSSNLSVIHSVGPVS